MVVKDSPEMISIRKNLGAAGTSFWNDPKQHLSVVFMMQAPSQLFHYSALLRNMIYAALTEPEKYALP